MCVGLCKYPLLCKRFEHSWVSISMENPEIHSLWRPRDNSNWKKGIVKKDSHVHANVLISGAGTDPVDWKAGDCSYALAKSL